MLSKLLSHETCAECRICCGFTDSDKWEIPIFAGEEESAAAERTAPVRQIPGTKSCVFDMEFHGNEIIMCPAASDCGCTLGEQRPFDCMIWPFRVNSLNGMRVITLSPVCPAVIKLPLEELCRFVNSDGFAERLFRHAAEFPETVKPYEQGYPILAGDL